MTYPVRAKAERVSIAREILTEMGYDGEQSLPVDGPYHEFAVEELLHQGLLYGQAHQALNAASFTLNALFNEVRSVYAADEEIR